MIKKFGNYETRLEDGATGAAYASGLEILNSGRYTSHSINIQNKGAASLFYKVLLYKDHASIYPETWVAETSIAAGAIDICDIIEKPCAKIIVQVKNNSGATTYEVSSTSRG